MKYFAALLLSFVLGVSALGQGVPWDDHFLTPTAPNAWSMSWFGHDEKTYFLQWSDDLIQWHYFPTEIRSGTDAAISYGVSSSANRYFWRTRSFEWDDQLDGDPWTADFDEDGLSNELELELVLDPLDDDVDDDGMDDGWERHYGLDPKNAEGISGAAADPDNDGLINIDEYLNSSNPQVQDTDGDTLIDGLEVHVLGTFPHKPDSDHDGLEDGFEVNRVPALNPRSPDSDEDGLGDYAEIHLHLTNPAVADSDGDGKNDGIEIGQGTSPTNAAEHAPPAEGSVEVTIIYGDPGDSGGNGDRGSEKYRLRVEPVFGDTRVREFINLEYGRPDEVTLRLKRGAKYKVKLFHEATDPQYEFYEGQPQPDYDYLLSVVVLEDGMILHDPQEITGSHYESSLFFAAGKEAYLIPLGVDLVSRDPLTGDHQNLGGQASESDARPTMEFTGVQATLLANGKIDITLSGKTRDALAEFLGSGSTSSIEVFVDGELATTISNLQQGQAPVSPDGTWQKIDSTRTFSKTFAVSNVAPGFLAIVARTNANAVGARGYATASVLVQKIQHGDIFMPSPPSVEFALTQSHTPTVQNSLTVKIGAVIVNLTEALGQPGSGVFVGNATINGLSTPVQALMPPTVTLTSGVNQFSAQVGYRGTNGNAYQISGQYVETSGTSSVFLCASPIALVESPVNLQISATLNNQKHSPRTFEPIAVRVALPSDFIAQFVPAGPLRVELNGQQVALVQNNSFSGDAPPAGTSYYYVASGAAPRLFLLDDRISDPHFPTVIRQAGEFRLSILGEGNDELFKESIGISNLLRLDEAVDGGGGGPPPAQVDPAFVDQTYLLFELVFGELGKNLLQLYTTAGLQVVFSEFWYVDPSDYTFDGIRPYESDEIPKLILNTSELKTPMEAAVALYSALQDLQNKSAVLLRPSLNPGLLNWDQTLTAFEAGNADADDLVQAWRNGTLVPLQETLTGFTETVKLGMSFTVVGDAVVTGSDASDQIQEGNRSGGALLLGALIAPNVLEKMADFCTRYGKRWIVKLGPEVLMDFSPAVQTILKDIPKDATVVQKMGHLRPHLEAGDIDEAFLKQLFDGGYLRSTSPYKELASNLGSKPFPWFNYRTHHDYPVARELEFAKAGIDINAGASSGRYLNKEFHKRIHGKGTTGWPAGNPWNYQWTKFFDDTPNPSAEQIEGFRDLLRSVTSDSSKSANEIQWPFLAP